MAASVMDAVGFVFKNKKNKKQPLLSSQQNFNFIQVLLRPPCTMSLKGSWPTPSSRVSLIGLFCQQLVLE